MSALAETHSQKSKSARPRRRRLSRWAFIPTFQQFNPARKPAWRWDWTYHYIEDLQPLPLPRRGLDPLLTIAVQLHLVVLGNRVPRNCSRLAPLYKHLRAALEIYEADGLQRAELEARVLARQSDAEISQAMKLSPKSVELYVAVFYDVRERLNADSWILAYAIGELVSTDDVLQSDIGWAWRKIAYYAGIETLELVLSAVEEPADLATGIVRCDLRKPDGRLSARAWLAVAAMVRPKKPKVRRELLRVRKQIIDSERPQPELTAEDLFNKLLDLAVDCNWGHWATASQGVIESTVDVQPVPDCEAEEGADAEGDRDVA